MKLSLMESRLDVQKYTYSMIGQPGIVLDKEKRSIILAPSSRFFPRNGQTTVRSVWMFPRMDCLQVGGTSPLHIGERSIHAEPILSPSRSTEPQPLLQNRSMGGDPLHVVKDGCRGTKRPGEGDAPGTSCRRVEDPPRAGSAIGAPVVWNPTSPASAAAKALGHGGTAFMIV